MRKPYIVCFVLLVRVDVYQGCEQGSACLKCTGESQLIIISGNRKFNLKVILTLRLLELVL